MATVITKNSSTASSVPAAGSLVQGELAVNVTDKKLYTKDSTAAVVKIVGSLGNQEANAVAITGGTITGMPTPSNSSDVSTKGYVDGLISTGAANVTLSRNWAQKTDGIVDATDYSSKAWSIGGTGVTNAAGASKEWATKLGGTVDGSLYSARYYSNESASSATLANDWATKTSSPVAGGEYSAKYHAQAAASSASSASTSASSALAAKTAAEAARDATLTAYDNFDDRYLGTKTSDPTVDNDGNPLVAGTLYFNSVSGVMRLYTGSAWVAAYVSGADYLARANNLSDLTSVSTARTNLGVSATGSDTTYAYRANNLSDLTNVATARTNLGLGTAATMTGPSGTIVGTTDTQTLTNKTIAFGSNTLTDVASTNTAQTFTGTKTFSGSSSALAMVLSDAAEVVTVSATAATGTINYDVTTQSVLYYTSNASANWTVNFRGSSGTSLNTVMSTGQSVTVVFLVTQGSTAYFNNAVQVDGSSVTPKWQGGTAPTTGNASSIDAYSYTIIKTGNAAFTVLAAQVQFK